MLTDYNSSEMSDEFVLVFHCEPDPVLEAIPIDAVVISTTPFSFEDELREDLENLATVAASGGFCGFDCHFPALLMEVRWSSVLLPTCGATDD